MNTVTIQLADALGIGRDEAEGSPSSLLSSAVKECMDGFSCAKGDYHANFLRDDALGYHLDETSKTYLMINADVLADVVSGNQDAAGRLIAAYYTISLSSIALENHAISKKKQKRMRRHMFKRDESIGCFVIASLCRSSEYTRDTLPGGEVLAECLATIKKAQEVVGGTLVLVDSRRAVFDSMYAKAGFEELYTLDKRADDGAEMIVSGLSIANPKSSR